MKQEEPIKAGAVHYLQREPWNQRMKTRQDEVVFCSSGCDRGGKSTCLFALHISTEAPQLTLLSESRKRSQSFPEQPAPRLSSGPAWSEMTYYSTKATLETGGTKDFYLGPRCKTQAPEST
ncbi:hypothetical protein Q8A73_005234 [Channa argus]|nr:hypothetical protein Q8A73_005234 [Channa argus]